MIINCLIYFTRIKKLTVFSQKLNSKIEHSNVPLIINDTENYKLSQQISTKKCQDSYTVNLLGRFECHKLDGQNVYAIWQLIKFMSCDAN